MKIVIACDSYKGCMSASEVVKTIEKGIKKANVNHQTICVPMADGGEGTAAILAEAIGGEMVDVSCVDAYGNDWKAQYSTNGEISAMDVASCIGLNMTPRNQRNPLIASSRGVGMMMKAALDAGCKKLIIGLGGSATNDGGMGILSSFGIKFFDAKHREIKPNVYSLNRIATVDTSNFQFDYDTEIIVMCDVQNTLLGKQGATYSFGRQKGIFPNQMEEIDGWMAHYVDKIEKAFNTDIHTIPGSGAAGGIGAVLTGIFHARMESGIDYLIQLTHLEKHIQDCDLVITGEGQSDAQTLYGKVPYGILQLAKRVNKPVLCLSGALSKGYDQLYDAGMIGVFSSADRAMTFQQALAQGPEKLEALAYSITKYTDGILGGIK